MDESASDGNNLGLATMGAEESCENPRVDFLFNGRYLAGLSTFLTVVGFN